MFARWSRVMPQTLLLLLALAAGCWAYSGGAPDQACSNLTPNHGVDAQPDDRFPYSITVSPRSIQPGDRVTLEIRRPLLGTAPIKGFFVQARDAQDPEGSAALGRFVSIDSLHKPVDCGGATDSGVTHNSNSEKRDVTVTWQSPSDLSPGSSVVFLVTVVQQRDRFWAGQRSDTVMVLGSEMTTEAAAMTTEAAAATTEAAAAETTMAAATTTPAGKDSSAGSSGAWMALVALLAVVALLRA